MISKEKIVEIIREETWVEVDSSRVYGIEEAAEKVLKIIEAAEQNAHQTGGESAAKVGFLTLEEDAAIKADNTPAHPLVA